MRETDYQRKFYLKKDFNELQLWIQTLERFNIELDYFSIIEKQLICQMSISSLIRALRRKNVLNMAVLCKYEQEIKTAYRYGQNDYDVVSARAHETKRQQYAELLNEQHKFKLIWLKALKQFRR